MTEKTHHNALNVEVIDENFYMPQLDRNRRIWIYKPSGYYQTDKRYPVIYMHDGQNLFDEANAFGEEWGIDETLNTLLGECIIVGIDNSEYRMTEYNFKDNEEHGQGEGAKYIDFIATTLKPVIDLNFRTRPDRKHTHIAGSSMGGLVTLYGAMHFPSVFGGAGVFSPSLWLTPDFASDLKHMATANKRFPQRFYFYGGENEGSNMTEHIHTAAELLRQYPKYAVDVEIDPDGEHCESCWRNKFADYYTWLSQESTVEVPKGKRSFMTKTHQHASELD